MNQDDEVMPIMFVAQCTTEEQAARVIEAFSRPMAGLVLDGINIMVMRPDND